MSPGVIDVARKQTRKSPDESPRPSLLVIKGRLAWYEWLAGLHKFSASRPERGNRLSLVGLIETAVAEYAKSIGYRPRPPER